MTARMDAIGIVVSDMGRSLDFYRLLGLEFPEGSDSEGHVGVTLANGVRLMLDTEDLMRSFDAGFEVPAAPGRVTLAFLFDSPSEVDRVHAAITGAGHRSHLDPFDAFWGQRYATVLDPDGTHIDLFADLEAA